MIKDGKNTRRTGFEPVRGDPNGFLVHRLNRSAICARPSVNEIRTIESRNSLRRSLASQCTKQLDSSFNFSLNQYFHTTISYLFTFRFCNLTIKESLIVMIRD